MVGWISAYIEHFTYAGLFVVLTLCGLGLPLPEDVALLAGGYLAHKGITRYPTTLVVSLLGVILGRPQEGAGRLAETLPAAKAWGGALITLGIVMLLQSLPGFAMAQFSGLNIIRPFFF